MSLGDLANNLFIILHITFLAGWACLVLLIDLIIPKGRKEITALLSAAGLAIALVLSLLRTGAPVSSFGGMVVVDGFATFLNIIFLGSGLVTIALGHDFLKRMGMERGEFYVLLMVSVIGMMIMAEAGDLIIVFLSLELLSLPLYVMAGFAIPRLDSEEAALKYFLLGAYSTAFVLFGIALVFGGTGTTALAGIVEAVAGGSYNPTLLLVGAALLLIGLGFKVAVVPFHMWTPDVYQGAPSVATAFMAVGAKVGGFAALLRVFILAFPSLAVDITPILWALAALTMVLGNLAAIAQSNIKRLLAYSSIAHAGYIMMAMVPYGQGGAQANAVGSSLFYMLAYSLTSFAAWAVVIALEKADNQGQALDDYAGLGRKHPALAAAMAAAMLSFIGVPPTLGFVGKFYVFRTVLEGGFVGLAVIGVLTSLVSAYYYLRVVVIMYMRDGEPEVRREPWLMATALGGAAVTVMLSIFAAPLFQWVSQAALQLF